MSNIVTAVFGVFREAVTRPLYQYDYGQVLSFVGVHLPDTYEAHFSNDRFGSSVTQIGGIQGVDIPDELLTTGKDIIAWLYLHTGEHDGETVYTVRIPVKARARPTDDIPSPVQQSAIDEAIAALNAGVDTVRNLIAGIPNGDENRY